MEHDKHGNGWTTFREHWWMPLVAVSAYVTSEILTFFTDLVGVEWINFFIASLVFLLSGAALIVYAKLPVYRRGRFFTFGVQSVPGPLAGYYRWGWRVFWFGVVLTFCLLLSRE